MPCWIDWVWEWSGLKLRAEDPMQFVLGLDEFHLVARADNELPYSLATVLDHLATDKKHALGRLNWVLPTDGGVTIRSDVPAEVVDLGLAAALRTAAILRGFETSQP